MISRLKRLLNVGTLYLPERDAWLEKSLAQIAPGSRILDAGAGETKYRKFCGHLEYVSQDFAQYDGRGNEEGFQTKSWDNSKLDIVSDITDIPVADGSFDAVMCVEVFEHVPDPVAALRELSRVLKPGGTLVLTVPFCASTHFAPYFFVTGFSKYWMEKFLPQNGLEIERLEYHGNYFEFLALELRRWHRVIEKYVSPSRFWFLLSKIAAAPAVLFLQLMSRRGARSAELLCYGIHVVARKR